MHAPESDPVAGDAGTVPTLTLAGSDPGNGTPAGSTGQPPIEALAQNARILVQARMLPMGKLNDEQIEQVRGDFRAYLFKHNLFPGTVTKEIGVSGSALSQWKNGKYAGDNEDVARKVNNWMERDASARRAKLPVDYVDTEIAESMRAIIRAAVDTAAMAAIVCPSGSGKSLVIEISAREFNGWTLYCDEDLKPRQFLHELALAVGVERPKFSAADLKRQVVDKLKGTRRPVFCDEAHRLPREAFSRCRSIHDQTGVPFIFAGTHEILDRINDASGGRGQMASRCLRYNALEHVVNIESGGFGGGGGPGSRMRKPLFSVEEIEKVFEKSKVRLTDDGLQMAWSLACLPDRGCIRTARRVVQLCVQLWPTEEVSRQLILQALPLLFGELGHHLGDMAEQHAEAMAQPTKARTA